MSATRRQTDQEICAEATLALDKIVSALVYLRYNWGADTPRDRMQANLDARALLINLENQIINETEERLGL